MRISTTVQRIVLASATACVSAAIALTGAAAATAAPAFPPPVPPVPGASRPRSRAVRSTGTDVWAGPIRRPAARLAATGARAATRSTTVLTNRWATA